MSVSIIPAQGTSIVQQVSIVHSPTWSIVGNSAANTAITLTRPLESGRTHIITGCEAVISGAAPTVDIPIDIMTGASNLWRSFIGAAAASGTRTGFVNNNLQCFTSQSASISAIAGGTNCFVTLNLTGYTI